MPKKLKVHPNQRVDIPDFVRAATEYTEETAGFNVERSRLDRLSRVLEGFRIEIADQTANPGQITVYNGTAFDRDGKTLNNEDQVNTAKSITLAGASTTFYVEVEFTESESDVDSSESLSSSDDSSSSELSSTEISDAESVISCA